MSTVKVKGGHAFPNRVPDTTVTISDVGEVTWEGEVIGFITKGSRTYSPPTHSGSRIARYHKKVAEWHGFDHLNRHGRPLYRCDTRQEVLRRMISQAMNRRAEAQEEA